MGYLLITEEDGTVIFNSGEIDEKNREADFKEYLARLKNIKEPLRSKAFETERMKILQELGYPSLASLFGVF